PHPSHYRADSAILARAHDDDLAQHVRRLARLSGLRRRGCGNAVLLVELPGRRAGGHCWWYGDPGRAGVVFQILAATQSMAVSFRARGQGKDPFTFRTGNFTRVVPVPAARGPGHRVGTALGEENSRPDDADHS